MLNGWMQFNQNQLKWVMGILAFLGVLIITLIVYTPYIPYSVSLKVGESTNSTITAPRFLEFQTQDDKSRTEALKKQRELLVKPVFVVDRDIDKIIQSDIANTITQIKIYKEKVGQQSNEPVPEELNFLPRASIDYVLSADHKTLNTLEYVIFQNLESTLSQGIKDIDADALKIQLFKKMKKLDLTEEAKNVVYQITVKFIQPNLVFSQNETELAIEREVSAILPFKTVIKKGEPVLYKNETVTAAHIETLKALNIYGVTTNLNKFFGIFMVCGLMFLLFERFLYYFNYKIYRQAKYFGAAYLTVFIVVAFARVFQNVQLAGFPWDLVEFKYLIPIPFAAMVLALLVTSNISLLCGTIISVMVAIMFKLDFMLFFYLFSLNAVTVFSSYKKYKRSELAYAGNIVGLSSAVLIVAIGLLGEPKEYLWYFVNIGAGMVNGLFSAMLSLAVLPYFEGMFKITTQQSLLEYSNLNHPLLKRLMITAPGTYQHSLMVANLAENAAEALNADPILCRVGAYFHDIGKMKRPMFFTENQGTEENPHEGLSPRMSKIIIASHTKDGVDLADKHKLPQVLKDIMIQHHGTTLVSFFYTQALQSDEENNTETNEEEFRYMGPKPQFKESGIIMLADSVEAAVRSMEKPTLNKIENVIDKIFTAKLQDDQLDECPLTLKEIAEIKQSFLNMFKGIYHSRLNYQDEIDKMKESQGAEPKPEKK